MRKLLVELGRIRTDLRVSAIIAKLPGLGGSAFKASIIRMLKGVVKVSVPTSRHEEQMVGKVIHIIRRGVEVVKKNFGYLKDPLVIFDEALPLILGHDDRFGKFWGYMNIGLDVFGENLVEKKGVNDFEGIAYFAELTALFIMQLARIPNSFISRGPFRRCMPVLIEVSNHEKKEIISRRLRESRPSESGLKELQEYFRNLALLKGLQCTHAPGVNDEIEKGTDELLALAKASPSATVRQYGGIMHSTFPDLLLKMSVHLAVDDAVFGKTVYDPPSVFLEYEEAAPAGPTVSSIPDIEVTITHVRTALQHLRLLMESTFDFIDRLVCEPPKIPVMSQQTFLALKILKGWGQVEEKSSTKSIAEFLKELVRLFGCSQSNARRIYGKIMEKGWIDSKQVGAYGSRIWLTAEGLRVLESESSGSQ